MKAWLLVVVLGGLGMACGERKKKPGSAGDPEAPVVAPADAAVIAVTTPVALPDAGIPIEIPELME